MISSSPWVLGYFIYVTENKTRSKSAVKTPAWFGIPGKARPQLQRVLLIISFWPRWRVTKSLRGLTVVLPRTLRISWAKWTLPNFGVGKKTAEENFHEIGCLYWSGFLVIPEMTLIDRFGRFGHDLFRKARGIHNSPVKSHRIRKSIGKERTYRKLLYAEDEEIATPVQ